MRPAIPIRVVLADRSPLYLAALQRGVRECGDIVLAGSAQARDEAMELVRREQPDVAVIGWLIGDAEQRESIDTLVRMGAICRVLCLFGHGDYDLALDALAAGASGCISKDADMTEVCAAIAAAGRGEALLPVDIQNGLLQRLRAAPSPGAPQLTAREEEVLSLAAAGLTSIEIARRLSITHATVKAHLHHVYDKLAVSGRAAAVAEALRRGMMH